MKLNELYLVALANVLESIQSPTIVTNVEQINVMHIELFKIL